MSDVSTSLPDEASTRNIKYDFSGRSVLITGASGGIGAEVSSSFASSGARCVLSGPLEERLTDLKTSLVSGAANAKDEDIFLKTCDLTSVDDIEELAKFAISQEVDTLVCNAGITKDVLLLRMKNEDWDSVLDINLKANFILARALAKSMAKKRFGRMIFISSMVGQTGNPGQVNYVSSKAGIIGMSKSIAWELASRGVTSNCIAPGFVKTPMTSTLTEAQQEAIITRIPCKRYALPSEVASSVCFLSSMEASYITGQVIGINGGMHM